MTQIVPFEDRHNRRPDRFVLVDHAAFGYRHWSVEYSNNILEVSAVSPTKPKSPVTNPLPSFRLSMKLKHLESCLSSLPNRVFPSPKIELEQYPTSVHLTSSIVLSALERGDAGPGTSILDLGCGTGMLGFGFALVQSDMVRQI